MEYKKHGVAGVEGGPEGQRTQVTRNKFYSKSFFEHENILYINSY